jgi:hypothetical protein
VIAGFEHTITRKRTKADVVVTADKQPYRQCVLTMPPNAELVQLMLGAGLD